MQRRMLSGLALLAALSIPSELAASQVVVVLPLVFVAPSDDYTLVPKAKELNALGAQIGAGIGSAGHLSAVVVERHDSGGCVDLRCAQRIGRRASARAVVFGTVTRVAATDWTTRVTLADVRSGRVTDTFTATSPGDYDSLMASERRLGTCVRRSLIRSSRCKSGASQP